MSAGLHISISAEPVFHLGSFAITNSIFTSWLVSGGLILFAIFYYYHTKNRPFDAKPTLFQSLIESVIQALYDLMHQITGSHKKARLFFPIIATFFLFIVFSNWSGLIPGVGSIGFKEATEVKAETVTAELPHETVVEEKEITTSNEHEVTEVKSETHDASSTNPPIHSEPSATPTHSEPKFVPYFRAPTADINTTLALAIFSIITVQFMGIKHLSLGYFSKFFDFRSPIYFVVGLLELMSEFSKIISFAFRLFGNIFAGEVLLAVIAFLIPVALPIPFLGLEIFVGLIQGLVFSLLSLVFFNMATIGHGDHDH